MKLTYIYLIYPKPLIIFGILSLSTAAKLAIMKISVKKTSMEAILPLRVLFLHEGNFQFIRNSYHARNWVDSYLLCVDDATVGYASLCGKEDRAKRDSIIEFYVLPPYRGQAPLFFSELLTISKAAYIECQSNDILLPGMLYKFAKNIAANIILFKDYAVTNLTCPEVVFRSRAEEDKLFEHRAEPEGSHVLDKNGEVVATGGFLLHYNLPYADLYMEVAEPHRCQGYGSFLIQELKKACYVAGRVPAARCDISNTASKATLLKAGLEICGYGLSGEVERTK